MFLPKKCFTKKGLTWVARKWDCKFNTTLVSCGAGYGPACNPYVGDTICAEIRPILCVNKSNIARPPYTPDPCPSCAYSAFPAFY